MSMIYCSAHDKMEDSDYVGIKGIWRAETSVLNAEYLETCDTYDGSEYRASIAANNPLPYDLPSLRKMRKLLMAHGGLTEYRKKIADIEHRILTLQDNPNHYE